MLLITIYTDIGLSGAFNGELLHSSLSEYVRLKKVRFEVGELAAKISGVTDKVRAAHAIWVRLKASGPD